MDFDSKMGLGFDKMAQTKTPPDTKGSGFKEMNERAVEADCCKKQIAKQAYDNEASGRIVERTAAV